MGDWGGAFAVEKGTLDLDQESEVALEKDMFVLEKGGVFAALEKGTLVIDQEGGFALEKGLRVC